jgi:putative transposase
MTKHQHTPTEILAKLQRAEQMAAEGKLQRDIATALNVSVMTYHRWRKSYRADHSPLSAESSDDHRIAKLQVENQRLRRLVTDLLLEKTKLEEELLASTARRNRATEHHRSQGLIHP